MTCELAIRDSKGPAGLGPLRLFPRSPWRVVVLIALGALAIAWRLRQAAVPTHLYDLAGVHPDALETQFNLAYDWLRQRFGVDAQIVLLNDSAVRDLEGFAVRETRRLRVGHRESGQGLLVVLNYATRRMRIEVGPQLQGVFTDAFTGYLLRNHLSHFTDPAHAEVGLRSLWHLIQYRTLQAVAGDEWDPAVLETVRPLLPAGAERQSLHPGLQGCRVLEGP
jgi:hypothetical protein